MKIVYLLFVCLLSLLPVMQVSAKTVPLGTGKGTLTLNSMDGLDEGDTVILKQGTYAGGSFTNLTGITIVPEAPGVTFNGSIIINHNNKVTFDGLHPVDSDNPDQSAQSKPVYGYTFSGFDGDAFVPKGNNMNLTIKGLLCSNIGGVIDGGANKIITYKGTDETTLYKNLTVDYLKCTGKTSVYDGTWEQSTTYNNVNIGMTLKHVIIVGDGTASPIKVFGYSIYQMVADSWTSVGPTRIMEGDCGFFTIEAGNVTLKNIYRSGGWGNLLRIWNCSLREPSDTYMYNCIDINTSNYTTFDCSISPAKLAPTAEIPIVGNNAHALYITSGDKRDITIWATNLFLSGSMFDGNHQYIAELKNCFAFDAAITPSSDKSSLFKPEMADRKLEGMDQSNNVDIVGPLPDGYLIDKVHLYPAPGSPLIGKGVVIPEVTTDIYGNPRGDNPDIGAVQHYDGNTPPPDESYDLSPDPGKISKVLDLRPAVILNAADSSTPSLEESIPYLKPIDGSQMIRYRMKDRDGFSFFKATPSNDGVDMDTHTGKLTRVLFKVPGDASGGPYTAEKIYKDYDAKLKADGWDMVYSNVNKLPNGLIIDVNRVIAQQQLVSPAGPQNCYYINAVKHDAPGEVHMEIAIFDFSQDDWFFKKDEVGVCVDTIQVR